MIKITITEITTKPIRREVYDNAKTRKNLIREKLGVYGCLTGDNRYEVFSQYVVDRFNSSLPDNSCTKSDSGIIISLLTDW